MGTAGGVKTTTLAVLVLSIIANLRGKKDVEVYGRKIRSSYIRSAQVVVGMAVSVLLISVLGIFAIMPDAPFVDVLYELTSAIGTVGLSRGLTAVLNTPAKLVGFGTNAGGSTLVSNAVIDKIVAESKVALTLNANVESVMLTATGEGTSITLGNNAVIAALATETRVEINGEGSVTSATTNDVLNVTGTIAPEANRRKLEIAAGHALPMISCSSPPSSRSNSTWR